MMPEKQWERFLGAIQTEIAGLRDAANRGQEPEQKERQSVKVKLQALQPPRPNRPRVKVRPVPRRDAR